MNTPLLIFIILFILAITVLIILHFTFKKQDKKSVGLVPNQNSFKLTNYLYWDSKPSDDYDKNYCQIYDIYPSTLKPSVLNNVPASDSKCYYSDQVIAQQMKRTCVSQNIKGSTGYTNLCVKSDGSLAKEGDVEIYYDSTKCSDVLTACPGQLGIISIPYLDKDGNVAKNCLTKDKSFSPCNPKSRDQQVASINYSYGFKGYYQDDKGPFIQLNYREDNKCLKYKDGSLSLDTCSNGPDWALLPPLILYFIKDNNGNYGDPVDPGTTGSIAITFPQSLIPIELVDLKKLANFTSLDEIALYVYSDENIKTLYLDNNNLIFISYKEAFSRDKDFINTTGQKRVYSINFNFINFALYNTIRKYV